MRTSDVTPDTSALSLVLFGCPFWAPPRTSVPLLPPVAESLSQPEPIPEQEPTLTVLAAPAPELAAHALLARLLALQETLTLTRCRTVRGRRPRPLLPSSVAAMLKPC